MCASLDGITTDTLQTEYRSVADSYSRVPLPGDLKLNDSKTGLKRTDYPTANVISRNSRYSETLLKILCSHTIETITENILRDMCVCLVAQMRYNQEEFGNLYVQGQFGNNTANFYRQLQRNTSVLPSRQVPILESAVKLATVKDMQDNSASSYGNRGGRYGFGRGGFRGRGQRFGRGGVSPFVHAFPQRPIYQQGAPSAGMDQSHDDGSGVKS